MLSVRLLRHSGSMAFVSNAFVRSPQNAVVVISYRPTSAFSMNKSRYREQREQGNGESRRIPVGGYVTLVIPVTAFCLGVWQVRRRQWKLDIIEQLKQRTAAQPVSLPDDLSAIDPLAWDYQPVIVTGHFDHSREILIKPRSRMDKDSGGGSLLSSSEKVGAHVVTPFVMAGTGFVWDFGETILVNRGWVPLSTANAKNRAAGQIEGPVTINGVYRKTETLNLDFFAQRPQFVGRNRPDRDYYTFRDVEAMAQSRNTLPVYIEAGKECTVPGGPIGGQTAVNPRNEHLQYVMTWWSLAIITSYMWYLRFLKVK